MNHARFAWGIAAALLIIPSFSHAQSADEIRKAIGEHNAQIAQLNKDIAQYQAQLDATSKKKQTLQNSLDQLNLSIKKVTASVTRTKAQISATQLEIQQLESGIQDKQASINTNEAGLEQALRRLDELESQPLVAQILASGTLSAAWRDIDTFETLQSAVRDHIASLTSEKKELTDVKTSREAKEKDLRKQKADLVTLQGSLNATKKAQSDLLIQTKSEEANYQKILSEKKAQEKSFEAALSDLQTRLNVAVSQSDITPGGKGILHWPLDNVRITQYFGNTAFAATGAYNGKGHNGVDFAAQIGTAVRAALDGTVIGTGNTDAVRGCYSFGKWVMIKHANGLDTMYAHLSQISAVQGSAVSTGDILGYSGETGYATGPHLHFGVYVSSVTQILRLGDATRSSTPCAGAVMPVAPLEGYLNPLNYL